MADTNTLSLEAAAKLKRRASYASAAVATLLLVAKFFAYMATNSLVLLSALVDSTMDLAASLIILYSVRQAQLLPTHNYRFGYGKAEPLAALAQAAFMAGSVVLMVYEAIHRLWRPESVTQPMLGVAVIVFSFVLTFFLVRLQKSVIAQTQSIAIDADSLHYRGDLWLNIFILLALFSNIYFGWMWVDPVGAIFVGFILLAGATKITRRALGHLLDRELPETEKARIRAVVQAHPGVKGFHDFRTRSDGDRRFIEMHLEIDPALTLENAHAIADDVEKSIQEIFPGSEVSLHQEPFGIVDIRLDHRLTR